MLDALLIDGNALVTRAIMGAAREEIDLGLPFTGGIYGGLNTLASVLTHHQLKPGLVVAFFDHSTPPARIRLIPGYKQREKDLGVFDDERQRAEAMAQIDVVYRLLPLLGITTLCYREREADDGLAAAARLLLARKQRPVIVTGDKDLWQTIAWGARVWDLNRFQIIDAAHLTSNLTIGSDLFLLWKALIGDASDNIKGATGIGRSRAADLIEEAHWHLRINRVPLDQFRALIRYLRSKDEPTTYELALIRDRGRVRRELRGIDLRDSFGPTTGLEKRLRERPPVRPLDFLQACRREGVKGFLPAFTRPFERAAARRDRKS